MFPNGSTNGNNQQGPQNIQNNYNDNYHNQNGNGFNNQLSNPNNNSIKNIDNNMQSPSENINKDSAKEKEQELNKNIIGNALSIEYENALREEIELNSPLISEQLSINILLEDYKDNTGFSNSIKEITNKYKYIRKVRRDGNCFNPLSSLWAGAPAQK